LQNKQKVTHYSLDALLGFSSEAEDLIVAENSHNKVLVKHIKQVVGINY